MKCPNCGEELFVYDRYHRDGLLVRFVLWAICKSGGCSSKNLPNRVVVLGSEAKIIPPYTNRGVTLDKQDIERGA